MRFGLPVIADAVSGGLGPLAGLLGAMDWLTVNAPECRWLLSVPVDVPFLPGDLTARLAASAESEEVIACASSAGTVHPIIALTPLRLRADLARMVRDEGGRKVGDWLGRHRVRLVSWPVNDGDPFLNVNAPGDLATAETRCGGLDYGEKREDRAGAA